MSNEVFILEVTPPTDLGKNYPAVADKIFFNLSGEVSPGLSNFVPVAQRRSGADRLDSSDASCLQLDPDCNIRVPPSIELVLPWR